MLPIANWIGARIAGPTADKTPNNRHSTSLGCVVKVVGCIHLKRSVGDITDGFPSFEAGEWG